MMFWLLATFAVSAGSITLARSHALVPYRRLMLRLHPQLGMLAACHYCTSHWISAFIVGLYQPVVGGFFWGDVVLAWLALVGLSALASGLIMYYTPFNSEE